MIKSMTAFGRATLIAAGKNYTVEIKSVNSRYFDCTVKTPRAYGFLEERVKAFLQQNGVSRGKVEAYIGIEQLEAVGASIQLDEAYAAAYVEALKNLRDRFSLSDDISVMTVAQNRDLFIVKKPEADMEQDWQDLLPCLTAALDAFKESREREGANLASDLLAKKEKLASMASRVSELQGRSVEAYRARLETKLRQVLENNDINLPPNDQRIITECAIFADKVAIDEELVRLSSHFKAFDEALAQSEPVGRRLDFLLQEMNREVNTTGSKAADAEITALVVDMKCELEKIREQIQNIE